jgi:hypothetical protein
MDDNQLLSKLKSLVKEAKKAHKETLSSEANLSLLTDEEIALVLAYRSKKLRISNNYKQWDFSEIANLSSATTYSNFEQSGKISLLNFIKVLRAFGRLSEIENLLKRTITEKIDTAINSKKEKKRVR